MGIGGGGCFGDDWGERNGQRGKFWRGGGGEGGGRGELPERGSSENSGFTR